MFYEATEHFVSPSPKWSHFLNNIAENLGIAEKVVSGESL
jgi:hypothetical protein